MKYNPDRSHRRSIRLQGYDYANIGAYFVTICLNQRVQRYVQGQQCIQTGQTLFATGQTLFVTGQPRYNIGQPQGVAPTFGEIENDVMILNDAGKMIRQIWDEMPDHYNGIKTGEFVIMPDHIHGIIEIRNDNVGATPCGCPVANNVRPVANNVRPATGNCISLPYLMDCFKTMTTTKYIQGVKTDNWIPFSKKLWQRNYWEHIIRDETEYAKIARYIRKNPALWGKKQQKRDIFATKEFGNNIADI